MTNIQIRLETPADYRAVETLTRNAFWWDNSDKPCNEHLLVNKLRSKSAFIPELDYIAELNGTLAGSVLYSGAKIIADSGEEHPVITFGPLSVAPEFQNQGVGKALMAYTIAEAKRLGYNGIVFFGHPDYYPRLGFRRAAEFGILTQDGRAIDPLMALPLQSNAFDNIAGRFHLDPVFNDLPDEELLPFDAGFPPKAPCIPVPIEVLYSQLPAIVLDALTPHDFKWLNDFRRVSEAAFLKLPGATPALADIVRAVMQANNKRWGNK